ncbi:MAG: 50S ribosomal protein L11 methyltransferase [Magnetococcales bacterium]|nr:50S ribosomal protein L11 methyltransferase [Magnetococcales bacterium]
MALWECVCTVDDCFVERVSDALTKIGAVTVTIENAGHLQVVSEQERFERCRVRGLFAQIEESEIGVLETRVRLMLAASGLEHAPVNARLIEQQDWSEAWKADYHPIPIGQRLLILPSWLEIPSEHANRKVLQLDPKMAFGSGSHETTLGCLEVLEALSGSDSLGRVLDLGTGSGILAIASALLGATEVVATDNDPVAIDTAEENRTLNRDNVQHHTSLNTIDFRLMEQIPDGLFNTVVANILASTLLQFLRPVTDTNGKDASRTLPDVLQPGGVLVLSGILVEQKESIQEACSEAGLVTIQSITKGDWVILTAMAPSG